MSNQTLATLIRTRYSTLVLAEKNIHTVYDNQEDVGRTDATIWCRLSILDGKARQMDVVASGAFIESVGEVRADIFTPLNQGDKEARDFADTIRKHFTSETVANVIYGVPSVETRGRQENYWMITVIIPFRYRYTK